MAMWFHWAYEMRIPISHWKLLKIWMPSLALVSPTQRPTSINLPPRFCSLRFLGNGFFSKSSISKIYGGISLFKHRLLVKDNLYLSKITFVMHTNIVIARHEGKRIHISWKSSRTADPCELGMPVIDVLHILFCQCLVVSHTNTAT